MFLPDMLPYLGIEATEKDEIKQYADWYSTVHSTEQDIFVVADGARNGLILKGKKGAVGSTLYCITPLWIDTDFLYYYLKLNEVQRKDTRHVENTFWNIPVPIVSLEKQKQIANDIKEALSTFEQQNKELEIKLIQSLKSLVSNDSGILENIQSLDDFKMAVLDLAVRGKLENSLNVRYKQSIHHKFKAKEVCENIEAGDTPKVFSYNPNDIPFLKVYNLKNNGIDFSSKTQYVSVDSLGAKFKKSQVYENDVLMNIVGPPLGKVALVSNQLHGAIINQAIALFRADTSILLPKFLYYILLEGNPLRNILPELKGNAGQINISINQCRDLTFSLPSIDEQCAIVQQVDTFFAKADEINVNFEKERARYNDLQKSILSSFYKDLAFDGNIEEILSTIEAERSEKNIEIFDLRKKQKQFRDSQSTLSKMKIIEIIQQSNGNKLTVEDLWTKSNYSENKEVELFYEELYDLETQNKIKVSFVDNSKIHSFITLQKDED